MAHFAELINNTVVDVLVINNNDVDNLPFPESESVGQSYILSLGIQGEWLQTSYNNNFRGVYAGIGYTYDSVADVFIAPTPLEP